MNAMKPDRLTVAGSTLGFRPLTPDVEELDARVLEATRPFRAAGLRCVDITDTWLAVGLLDEGQRKRLVDGIVESGLNPVGVSVVRRSILDPESYAANIEYTRNAIDVAHALGTGVVSVGFHQPLTAEQRDVTWFWSVGGQADDRDEAERLRLAGTRLRELADYAADRNIALSLELYEHTLLGSGAGALAVLEAVGRHNVGINPDLGNLYRTDRPSEHWSRTFELCLPHTNYWHVKNYYRVDGGDHAHAHPAPLADGDIDYRTLIATFRGRSTAPIVVEHYGGDATTVIIKGCRYLDRLQEEQE